MSGISHRVTGPLGVSVKRHLRQSNLMDMFNLKKLKHDQNDKPEIHERPSTSTSADQIECLSGRGVPTESNASDGSKCKQNTMDNFSRGIGDPIQKSTDVPEAARKIVGETTLNRWQANSLTITQITPPSSSREVTETLPTEIDSSPPLFPDDDDSNASSGEPDIHLGAPFNDFNKMPDCSLPCPPLKPSSNHTVLIRVPIVAGEVPRPHPERNRDIWDSNHVRMPCSPENLYPMDDINGGKTVESRWNLIRHSLQKPIISSFDLEEAIKTYNSRYADKWDFSGLHTFFTEDLDREEAHAFFGSLLPKMIDLALDLPKICTMPIPLLRKKYQHSITMSQKQVSSLLANAFFCTFPRRNAQRKHSEYSNFPDINFVNLFSGGRGGSSSRKTEKLKCILHYFRQVTKRERKGTITFTRQVVEEFPKWEKLATPFTKIGVSSSGTIEDDGSGMLEVDFANKFIGGGVLGRGCVQEEIRFVICPELLITRLFTEVLGNNECLIVTGCERFSKYDGYADTFQWDGNFRDELTPRDSWGRICTRIVAIDAIPFTSKREQYSPQWMTRELNKAFTGFYEASTPPHHLPAVATGNWGCGAFGGDSQLKSLLQLMAAAKAGRDVVYFTFRNPSLCKEIFNMHKFLVEKKYHIGDVWKLLVKYNESISTERRISTSLFKFIYKSVAAFSSDTEVDSSSPMSLQASPQQEHLDDTDLALVQQYTPSTSKQSRNTENPSRL